MAFRSQGRHARAGGPRRKTAWAQGPGSTGLTSITASSVAIIGSGSVPTVPELTVARIRGLFDIFLTSSTSPGDGFFGALGIGMVQTPAFAAGISAIPTPLSELGSENWLWLSHFSVHEASADGQGSGTDHQRVFIDSKAMRKQSAEQTLYIALEVVEIGTAAASLFMDTRVLDFLP